MKLEINIYNAEEKLPKLLPIDPKKKRYQIQSKRCLVWFKLKDPDRIDLEPRFAVMFNNNYWVIEGIQGRSEILKWMYVPKAFDNGK